MLEAKINTHEIVILLLQIIHRPCLEQLHVETVFYLPNYTYRQIFCVSNMQTLLTMMFCTNLQVRRVDVLIRCTF